MKKKKEGIVNGGLVTHKAITFKFFKSLERSVFVGVCVVTILLS
jgi:hypothetical protein